MPLMMLIHEWLIVGEGTIEYEVLQVLPFDSARKRMSVVLRHPETHQIIVYCKGADSAILPRLAYTRKHLLNPPTILSSILDIWCSSFELVTSIGISMMILIGSELVDWINRRSKWKYLGIFFREFCWEPDNRTHGTPHQPVFKARSSNTCHGQTTD